MSVSSDPDRETPIQSPENFYKTELHRTLSEQRSAIAHFRLLDSPDTRTSCDAEVRTLEEKDARITLSSEGYSLKDSEGAAVFETIEGLLEAISPAYTAYRQQALVAALNKLL